MINKITPVILTYNEEPNISRTLNALQWAKDIVVVDSMSSDRTEEICRGFAQVRFVKRAFDNHKNQWNYAISETAIKTEWILSLDADYLVTEKLRAELSKLVIGPQVNAYYAKFVFAIHGRSLAGSLYPPIAVLFRKGTCEYMQDGHTQRLKINGKSDFLWNPIVLDDRKPISHWIISQSKYAKLEADKICSSPFAALKWPDRLRKMLIVAPWFVPLYTFFVKRTFLAGWHGLYYCFQRATFEFMLALYLLEKNIQKISNKNE
jgi:glycosyltransferase involved in cell wall biosynthesis